MPLCCHATITLSLGESILQVILCRNCLLTFIALHNAIARIALALSVGFHMLPSQGRTILLISNESCMEAGKRIFAAEL